MLAPPTVASGPLSVTFPAWAKALAMQMVYNLFLLNNFLLAYTKNSYNQRGFSKRCLRNSKRTEANADNEAIHNPFRNGWL